MALIASGIALLRVEHSVGVLRTYGRNKMERYEADFPFSKRFLEAVGFFDDPDAPPAEHVAVVRQRCRRLYFTTRTFLVGGIVVLLAAALRVILPLILREH